MSNHRVDRQETTPTAEQAAPFTLTAFGELLERLPMASFFAATDPDCRLLYANPAFYRLLGCSRQEFQYKYGNRLSALTADLPHVTSAAECEDSVLEQCLRRVGKPELWLLTQISPMTVDGALVLNCVATDITEQKLAMKRLVEYQSTAQRVGKLTQNEAFQYDLSTQRADLYAGSLLFGQISPEEQQTHNGFSNAVLARNLVSEEHVERFREAFSQLHQGQPAVCEFRARMADGDVRWVRMTLELREEGDERRALGVVQDISQQKEASLRYLTETQYYQAMLAEKDAYAQVDVTEDHITRIGGLWSLYNEIIGTVSYSVLIEEFINKVVHPEDRRHYSELMQRRNLIDSLGNGVTRLSCQFRRIVDQNKMLWMEIRLHLFADPNTRHVLALLTLTNIDQQKRQELKLLFEAERDPVTNAYNKRSIERETQKRLGEAVPEVNCALVLLRLTEYRMLRERYGHRTGDKALVRLSQIVAQLFRREDLFGRLSEDEFVLFLRDVGHGQNLEKILERLRKMMAQEKAPRLACDIGVAVCPGGSSYTAVLRQAAASLRQSHGDSPPPETLPDWEPAAALMDSQPEAEESGNPIDHFVAEQGDLAYLVDVDTFELLGGNRSLYDRLGMTADQCRGMKCYELLHKRSDPCPFCSRANWSRDRFYLWRNMNEALEQEFLIKNKLVTWQGREVMLALSVDISNDKNVADSLDSGATESHYIISGVQHMTDAPDLGTAIVAGLETVASYFRAELVEFWKMDEADGEFKNLYSWHKNPESFEGLRYRATLGAINRWLHSRKWDAPVVIESHEAMLCESFEMYELMKLLGIHNHRWHPLKDGDTVLGILSVGNLSANFANTSFLPSFGSFIVSEWKKCALVDELRYANSHDELTGLLSRSSYEEFLARFHSDSVEVAGVMVADMNDLKGINARQGFRVGDRYIQRFAELLKEAYSDVAMFRLNGDEFLVVDTRRSWKQLSEIAARLEARVVKEEHFTVSCGCAWDDLEKDLGQLIDQASRSMNINKKRYYDSAQLVGNHERHRMLQELVEAVERREFEVFLQPKVELATGQLAGAEALVRYRHPELGYLPPVKFVGLLERNNLIRYVDLFVFEEVCRLFERWESWGENYPTVSLNFSRLTLLEHDILASVESIFDLYNIPRHKLEIELTESMSDMGKSILYQAAHDLCRAGFSISLDDFGTSYTNLAILSELEFDVLKIDKSLIGTLDKRRDDQIVLKNIIAMCEDLSIKVVAEGVETPEQEEILRLLGCQYGQGYLYGKPVPVQEFEERYLLTPATC